ncbi:MAG: hypothetical protein H7145_07810 [Akkermansiaceae bacterium]|nr:hypothetical protein [Armatimonadota bacterium]
MTIGIYSDNANPDATQKRYMIESKATMPSGASTIVRAYAQQVSFGKYAFFADIDSGGYWDWNNHFEGPFHSNCSNSLPSTFLWKAAPPDGPIFQYEGPGALETTVTPKWWKNTTGAVSAPQTDAEWKAVAKGGLASVSISSSNFIPLPTTNYSQMYVALGQTPPTAITGPPSSGVPTLFGVTVSNDGGIFIHGDCESMILAQDGVGSQKFTIVTNPSSPSGSKLTQTVTANANSITVQSVLTNSSNGVISAAAYPNKTYDSSPKGLLYCDGNISSLSGTVADNTVDSTTGAITYRNQWSIFTDTANGNNGKDVTITDSLTYTTKRDFTKPQAQDADFNLRAGTLGIVANDVIVSTKTPSGTYRSEIDAHADIFCTGTYKAENSGAVIPGTPKMTNVGGVIVKTSGIFAIGNNGAVVSGRSESYHYDQRLADHPPPYFPTTGNHYAVTSYQIVKSMLQ